MDRAAAPTYREQIEGLLAQASCDVDEMHDYPALLRWVAALVRREQAELAMRAPSPTHPQEKQESR